MIAPRQATQRRRRGTQLAHAVRRGGNSVSVFAAPRARHVGVATGSMPKESRCRQSAIGQSKFFCIEPYRHHQKICSWDSLAEYITNWEDSPWLSSNVFGKP